MKNYLQRRNGTYYFRKAVPKDVRHLFPTKTGKPATEWVWSLETTDYDSAKRLANRDDDKTALWITQARKAIAAAGLELPAKAVDANPAEWQARADAVERRGIEAAEFFEQHYFEEEMRAEADPLFAEELQLRAAKARERRRLDEAEQAREELNHSRKGRSLGLMALFEKYAQIRPSGCAGPAYIPMPAKASQHERRGGPPRRHSGA